VKPLNFSLDFRSSVPGYLQIVEQVQNWLNTGVLKPGDQLPTVRQLASELRVNFNTIARAYRILDDAGMISTQRGRGTYLLDQLSEKASKVIKQESLQLQVKRLLQSLNRQGFSPEETDKTIQPLLESWREGSLGKEFENESN
jgi:GntR family transcriptional regulator